MKIKLDEGLPVRLAQALSGMGHDVDTVPTEGIAGAGDLKVWETAQISGRFLITQDLDFSDMRRFTPGTHNGILLVRMHQPGRHALIEKVTQLFENEGANDWGGSFVVVTDRKIRIRRPQ